MGLTTAPGNIHHGNVAAPSVGGMENPAPSVKEQYVNDRTHHQQQQTPAVAQTASGTCQPITAPPGTAVDSSKSTPAQSAPAGTRAADWNSKQPPKIASVASLAPVTAVASQVPASGGVASEVESSGPAVVTDGYEDWTGTWEQLPGSVMQSCIARPHDAPGQLFPCTCPVLVPVSNDCRVRGLNLRSYASARRHL